MKSRLQITGQSLATPNREEGSVVVFDDGGSVSAIFIFTQLFLTGNALYT